MPDQIAPGSAALTNQLLSPRLLDRVNFWYGDFVIGEMPSASPDGDQMTGLASLLDEWRQARVVLFPDVWPGDVDCFFRLRLLQVLDQRPPLPALSVVVLSSSMMGLPLAGHFAERFRFGWPFARCVFLTEGDDCAPLSERLGLPVTQIDDPLAQPVIIASGANTRQRVALQVQRTWKLCGNTVMLENQVEDLVRAGYLTVRVFADGQWRRGATLRSRLDSLLRENSINCGAHVNVIAVPDGPPSRTEMQDPEATWRNRLVAMTSCRIHDDAIIRAAAQAECVITNDLECVGAAIALSPQARLLLTIHEDRAAVLRHWAMLAGRGDAVAMKMVSAAARVQAQILGVPDICCFASAGEMSRLATHCRRAVVALPRIYPVRSRSPVARNPAPPRSGTAARSSHIETAGSPPLANAEMDWPDGTNTALGDAEAKAAVRRVEQEPPPGHTPRFDLLLVGSDGRLNVMSVQWFLDRVWRPYLEARGFSVAIIGRVGELVYKAAYASPLLHFLGMVEDLEAIRSWCRLTVVPDAGGAGLSMKLLTTLAAGHPVATTSVGLRGLDPAIAAILPAYNTADTLAADIIGLIDSEDRLEERRRLVQQAGEATRSVAEYAGLIRTAPQPTAPGMRKRLAQWSRIAADAEADSADPYTFSFKTAFPMSGTKADSQVLLDGWHEPEPWGRWTDGADAAFRITLEAPTDEPLALELDLVPSAVGANLRLGVDGTMFPLIDPVYGANAWDIPAELSAGKTRLVVSLHAGETVCPAAAGHSSDDRVLGIGVSAVRLLSRRPTLCQLNETMPTRSGEMPSRVLLSGWHGPEEWGCWTNRTTASLHLTMNEPLEAPVRLELELALPQTDNPPSVVLTVNGMALPPITPAVGVNVWELPRQVTIGRTELDVLLTVPDTFSNARAGRSADDRELGIGLIGIKVVPVFTAFYNLGSVLRLATPTALDEILLNGWHPPEHWGCWTSHRDAELRVAFRQPLAGPFRLEMDLMPAANTTTALTITVNGQALEEISPVDGSNNWILPESLTEGQRELVIGLRVANTSRPADTGVSPDNRDLGVGVRHVSLHRQAPAICPIGTLIAISKDAGDRGMLWTGWHELERWGCWSAGSDAVMWLRFDTPLEGAYILEFDLVPPLADTSVAVSVNDMVLDAIHAVEGPNEWTVPANCADGRTELMVRLLVESPARPSDVVKDSTDDRLLGVGVRGVRVRPRRFD